MTLKQIDISIGEGGQRYLLHSHQMQKHKLEGDYSPRHKSKTYNAADDIREYLCDIRVQKHIYYIF